VRPLVALHGFTQTGRHLAEVASLLDRTTFAPDLPGHGSAQTEPTLDGALRVITGATREPGAVIGYSMGARLALHHALAAPGLVTALVLVSGTAGIEDTGGRARRRHADDVEAARIERIGVAAFVAEWTGRPMFAGLAGRGQAWLERDRALRCENTASGLAAALRGLGQGALPPLWSRLDRVASPVLVVVGEQDARYVGLGERIAATVPDGRLVVVAGAGHAVLGESPEAAAEAIGRFLAGRA
jgi:2-succinyl-6-hydroxy-2,4-cyclohexadiene-1-carboxylate synthase